MSVLSKLTLFCLGRVQFISPLPVCLTNWKVKKKERKLINMCYLKTDALQFMSKYVSVSVYVSILQYIRQCLRFAWALWRPTMPAVFEAERSSVPLPFPRRPLRCQWLASQCTQGQRLRRKPFKCEYVISACNFKAGRWKNCLCVHINPAV